MKSMVTMFRRGLVLALIWFSVRPGIGLAAVDQPKTVGVLPAGGIFASNVPVAITSSFPVVRFTLDGSEVTSNAASYAGPLMISNSCLLLARGFASNGVAGETAAAAFSLLDTNLPEFKSTLPLVVIDTFGRFIMAGTNVHATARVIDTAGGTASLLGPADYSGRAAVKLRGYSSLRYPKKSFALQTHDASGDEAKVPLLGFPAEHDWVLYAPYLDKSLIRDVLAYEWSNQMGRYASRTRFVELFVNETTNRLGRAHYAGVYVLEEKVKRDAHRVNIHKLTPKDNAEPEITGGYIFKKDHIDETEGKEAAIAAIAAAQPVVQPTKASRGWHRTGYPTGAGGFPGDAVGFEAAWTEPPDTNIITATNVITVTNVAWFTNQFPVTTITVTTNIHAIRTFAWTTNVLPVTNVTMLTNVLTGTNVAALTNVVNVTNLAAVPNVAPFTGQLVFTNRATFTNVAVFTNVTVTTNIASLTNITLTTNVVTVATIGSRTNLVSHTNLTTAAGVFAVTNVTSMTNLTVAEMVDEPVPPSPIPKPAPLLSLLVVSGQGFTTSRTNAFFYVEPKEERITPEQRAWLSNYVNHFEAALYGPDFRNPTNGYATYIDVDSFIDHHLIVETTKNIDGYRFSTFYTKDRGGKLKMEPIWDWNLALGNARGRDGYVPQYWYWPQLDDRQYSWFRRLFDDPDFAQRYVDRWAELRTNVFAPSNMLARIDQLAALLKEPAARNFERWPILGTTAGLEYPTFKTWAEELGYLKGWITNRLTWINAQFLPEPILLTRNSPLSLTSAVGRIVFTLDGSDPRVPGGGVSASAQTYQQPVPISGDAKLVARIQQGARWSSPLRAQFVTKPPESGN